MAVDVWKYREIILNGISCKNHVVIPVEDVEKYKNFTKFINSHIIKNNIFIPFSFMVGYNIETIDGYKWMPVFNHQYGRDKEALNNQFLEKYKQLQIDVLKKIGFPSVVVRIISKYF